MIQISDPSFSLKNKVYVLFVMLRSNRFTGKFSIAEKSSNFSVLGSRILIIAGIVLSSIGAIQVWLACKCCILVDENVKPCLLLTTGKKGFYSFITFGMPHKFNFRLSVSKSSLPAITFLVESS